jgi:hypothetical protein
MVKHIQKQIRTIAVISNNIKLRQGTQLHIQVDKEVIAIHIAPIIEQIRNKVPKIQLIIAQQINSNTIYGQIQVSIIPKMIQGHKIIQQQIDNKDNNNV